MEVESPKSKTGKRHYVRKRPFEKTPARVAAYTANFQKAVAAPNEKRYRSSEKRNAANRKSLEKGRAVLRQRSAAQAEQEQLCECLESLFPNYPPQETGIQAQEPGTGVRDSDFGPVPEPDSSQPGSRRPNPEFGQQDEPQPGRSGTAANDQSAIGNRQSAIPKNPNPLLPDSATALRQVAQRVSKRRRHFARQARREGRQVMRLLTLAAQFPSPNSKEEALELFLRLVEIFTRSRAVARAEHLDHLLERALLDMLEARYGREVFVGGQPLASLWRAMEADYQEVRAKQKAEREARRAAREQAKAESGEVREDREEGTDTRQDSDSDSEGNTENQQREPAETAADQAPQARGRGPELPKTFEEFWDLFSRAFAPPKEVRELDGDRMLLRQLAESVWARLHLYERQVQQESERLAVAFQAATEEPVASLEDLRYRADAIQAAFKIETCLTDALAQLSAYLEQDIRQLAVALRRSSLPRGDAATAQTLSDGDE